MRKWLILLFPFLLLVACQSTPKVEMPDNVQMYLEQMPVESNLLFYANFQEISKAPLATEAFERFRSEFERGRNLNAFKELESIFKLDDVTDFLVGVAASDAVIPQPYVLVNGGVSEQKLNELLDGIVIKEHGKALWSRERVGDHTIYLSDKAPDLALGFIDSQSLCAGPKAWVLDILSGKKIQNHFEARDNMLELMKRVRYGDQFWILVDKPMIDKKLAMLQGGMGNSNEILASISSAVFSARVFDAVEFEGKVQCSAPQDAEVLVDLMKGGLAAVKLTVSSEREAVDAFNGIKIYQQGADAVARGTLSKKFFEIVSEKRFGHKGGMGQH